MSRVWLMAVLILATCALYVPFLSNPLVFDDIPFFRGDVQSGIQPVERFKYSAVELRSLPYASLVWSYELFGQDITHFRIENLILHLMVSVVMFFFLSAVLTRSLPYRSASMNSVETLAIGGAILFAMHPVAVYAVGYLVQRTIVMATLFSLLSMLVWIHGMERGKRSWLWGAVAFYYLAVLSKEHAIMLPAVLLALTVLLHEDWKARLKRYWSQWLALVLIALFVVISVKGVVGSVYEINAPEMLDEPKSESNYLLSVLTQSWLFFKYAGLWLLPNPRWMSADMREYFAVSIDYFRIVSLVAFLGWGAVAARLLFKRGRLGLFGFAMLFPWLMFMTELSTIRIQEIFVLYRSYLWAAGGCIAVALLLDYFDKRLAKVVIVATAIAMIPVSLDRLASFSLPVLLWTDAEKLVHDRLDAPGAYRIYYNLGTEYVKLDMLDVGMAYFEKAVKIKPDWPFTYNNMGVVYLKTGQWNKAIESFNRSIELVSEKHGGKTYARSFFGRATAHEQMGNLMAAQADYSVSCKFEGKGCEKLAQ